MSFQKIIKFNLKESGFSYFNNCRFDYRYACHSPVRRYEKRKNICIHSSQVSTERFQISLMTKLFPRKMSPLMTYFPTFPSKLQLSSATEKVHSYAAQMMVRRARERVHLWNFQLPVDSQQVSDGRNFSESKIVRFSFSSSSSCVKCEKC